MYRDWLDAHCDRPFQLTMIAGEGSGERLDRDEWGRASQAVETSCYDLVITEDLGRIVRRIHAFLFCELAEDHCTRVIAINDHIDTADEGWRVSAVFASMRHEMHNEDTSKRIRRTLRNRFTNGGVVQFPIYGYIKPPGSSSDAELTKDSAAAPILERWFTMLEEGASFAEVADMLNSLAVKPGQFCRKDTWDGPMVARVTRNPILKGYRIRNKFMTKRENRTGRRKSIKAPPGELLVRICPHLQHIEPERWDRLNAMLKERNGACRRRLVEGRDPRAQVPKKRTRFPGQTVFCGVCGRMYIFGGHHDVAYLICSGATAYACWNGAPLHEVIARQRICDPIFDAIEGLPGFDEDFRRRMRDQERNLDADENAAIAIAERDLKRVQQELAHLVDFVRKGQYSAAVAESIERSEAEKVQIELALRGLQEQRRQPLILPSADEIRELARASFKDLAADSHEFARRLRIIVPRIVVFPYRLIDCNKVVLRAKFRLRLSRLVDGSKAQALLAPQLDSVIEVDLFDKPQREVHRQKIMELRREMTEAEAAARCNITKTAAQYAARLQRMMDRLQISDPYVPVTEPPADSGKLRRHLHPRYKFEPLPNAGEL